MVGMQMNYVVYESWELRANIYNVTLFAYFVLSVLVLIFPSSYRTTLNPL